MLHIYPMCGIFYLPSIDTGKRDHQFNVSPKRHPAGILLMKVLKFWGSPPCPGIEPVPSRAACEHLNHYTTQLHYAVIQMYFRHANYILRMSFTQRTNYPPLFLATYLLISAESHLSQIACNDPFTSSCKIISQGEVKVCCFDKSRKDWNRTM